MVEGNERFEMKVQWQLVDIETKKVIKVDDEFELVDFMRRYFDGSTMNWEEASLLFGDPTSIKNPIGLLNATD